jgi:hypothetical protein
MRLHVSTFKKSSSGLSQNVKRKITEVFRIAGKCDIFRDCCNRDCSNLTVTWAMLGVWIGEIAYTRIYAVIQR